MRESIDDKTQRVRWWEQDNDSRQQLNSTDGIPCPPSPLSKVTLFDGPHEYHLVAAYAFLVGTMFGGGIVLAIAWPQHYELGAYIAVLGLFHQLEYFQTAIFNRPKLSLDSFLLNQSAAYQIAIVAGFVEYALEYFWLPALKQSTMFKIAGLVLVVGGEALRAAAMATAKSNFNHIVQSQKNPSHVLVTHGVYSVSRHPAYAGFFWYSVGTQILLCNPVCTLGFAVASWYFFHDRIPEEEEFLVSFFGKQYIDYRKRVPIGIPFL